MLMAPGDENLGTIEKNLADLVDEHRELVKRVNGNCSTLRDHAQAITKLSEKQRETTRYLAKIALLES